MKKVIILTTTLLIAFLSFKFLSSSKGSVSSIPPITPTPTELIHRVDQDVLFNLVQQWRMENNLQTYVKSDLLCKIAEIRVREIYSDFSHRGLKGKAAKYCPNSCLLSENIAENIVTGEADVLKAWLNSPPHAAALRQDFKYSCLRSDGIEVVQLFSNF